MGELDHIVSALREIARGDLGSRIASNAAKTVDEAIKRTLSAAETPEGKQWGAKRDGGRAYKNAAGRIKTDSSGNLVRVTLSGPEVYGHFGHKHKKGVPPLAKRQMLPDAGGEIPASVASAIEKAASEVIGGVLK